jgi:hypothetical protein
MLVLAFLLYFAILITCTIVATKYYNKWLNKPITSVKPSGTVSLLDCVSPGVHPIHTTVYSRRK